MKIKIQCKSLLLEKALKMFLKKYIVAGANNYDILISDYEINSTKLFLIQNTIKSNIKKPFTKRDLFSKLRKFSVTKTVNIEDEMKLLLEEYTHKLTELNKKKYA